MTAVPGPPSWSRRAHVFVGGALGTALRMLIVTPLAVAAEGGWPLATLLVNIGGAFVLGLLVAAAEAGPAWRSRLPLLGTGVLGSLTTFSALAVGTVLLVQDGRPAAAAAYLAGSIAAGLLAADLGLRAVRGGRRRRDLGPTGRMW